MHIKEAGLEPACSRCLLLGQHQETRALLFACSVHIIDQHVGCKVACNHDLGIAAASSKSFGPGLTFTLIPHTPSPQVHDADGHQ